MGPSSVSPAVVVLTPTKNRRMLLCEAMDSVQAQTFPYWEHVIIDDGSDDGTAEEVERRARTDPRIRFIRRPGDKAGANVCRNLGIQKSTADLIVFLDSDDLLRPHCLERRVETMTRNADVDFAIFSTAVFEKVRGDLGDRVSNDQLGDDLTRFLCFECPWIITGPIWRRAALLQIGCFDESLPSWQDVDLHIRAISAGLTYIKCPDVDHDIRWQFEHTKVSVQQRRSMRHLEAAPSIFAKFERLVREVPGMNWNRQRALCGLYFYAAEMMMASGAGGRARACWKIARDRGLAGRVLYVEGLILLGLMSLGSVGAAVGARAAHKWKGMVRFRTIPELLG